MADDTGPVNLTRADALAKRVEKIVADYGIDSAELGFAFLDIIMPFAVKLAAEGELINAAIGHDLDRNSALDALALMGALKQSENPHKAWLASEILGRTVADPEKVLACLSAKERS